jgi:hypothetical protein
MPTYISFLVCLFVGSIASASAQNATSSAGLKIVVIKGEDAVNVIQQKSAVAPIVEVRDRNDLPVAGATVVFTVNGSGATFAGAQTLSVVTNAAGQATAAGLTPTAAGAVNISATAAFQGQTAAVTISQSNVLTAAAANAANAASAGSAASGAGGISAVKVLAIVGGIGAVGGGVAVAAGGSGSDSSASATTSVTTPTTTTTPTATATTPVATSPTTPAPDPNRAPVITTATVTPDAALVGIDTPIALQVQASDADSDPLTYLWEFPDGTRSDQRAFSRIFQLGGTWRIRVTVSDGKTSTSSELTLNMKTLTGTWDDVGPLTSGYTRFVVLNQNGSSITGAMTMLGAEISLNGCPVTGSIRPGQPQIVWDSPACPNTSSSTNVFPSRAELNLGSDTDTLVGLFGTPSVGRIGYPMTLRRR